MHLRTFIAIGASIYLSAAGAPDVAPGTVLSGSHTINGSNSIMNGDSGTGYFVQAGHLTINNATLQNFATTGGAGSGGGAGMGGALFINTGAVVTLNNVNFLANTAVGGQGGVGTTGGTLNNLLNPTSNGSNGSNGDAASGGAAYVNGGNGGVGFNAASGGNATNGIGGSGGRGGDGSDGSAVTAETVKSALDLAKATYDAASSAAATSIYTSIAATFTAQAAAASAGVNAGGPTTVNLAPAFGTLAAQYTTLATDATADLTQDGIRIAYETAYLAAMEVTKLATGAAGNGGGAGAGGNGGRGSDGFGGGAGGSGGNGGNAYSGDPSKGAGGAGGSGGNGGLGGFGGGGGAGGAGGLGGSSAHGEPGSTGSAGAAGLGGFGAGNGSGGAGFGTIVAGGNGGSGYGGSIFVRKGATLIITGNAVFDGNGVRGGAGQEASETNTAGMTGGGVGTDLFMMKGSTVILDAGEGNVITFNGDPYGTSIADDSASSLIPSGATSAIPSGQGADITIRSGLVVFNGTNVYSGQTKLEGGVLQAQDGDGIYFDSNINFFGGVLQSNGTFGRYVGAQSNRVQWTGSGGFAAVDGDLNVRLSNGQTMTWGINSFVTSGSSLIFGSSSATDTVIFENGINLNGGNRSILVKANAENTDHAVLEGILSNGALTVGNSSHVGTLILTNANTYQDGTTIDGGTLALKGDGSLYSHGSVAVSDGANFDISQSHDQTIGTLAGTGTVYLGHQTLTLNQGTDTTFAGVLADGGMGGGIASNVIKQGAGRLTLSGNNSYTGSTLVAEGILTLDGSLASKAITIAAAASFNNNASGLASDATVTNNGAFYLNSSDTVSALINTGVIYNSGHKLTAATYALNDGSDVQANLGAGKVTANGTVTIKGTSDAAKFTVETGITTLASAHRLLDSADVTVASGAALAFGGDEQIGSLNGAGNLSNGGGRVTVGEGSFAGVVSGTGGLTKVSESKLILTAANSYTGSTIVNEGTLELSEAGSLASDDITVAADATLAVFNSGLAGGSVLTNSGKVDIGLADEDITSLVNSGTIDGTAKLTAATYQLDNGSIINANLGTGALTAHGTVTLNGISDAETVTVSEGSTLILGAEERLNNAADVSIFGSMVLGGNETIRLLNGNGEVNILGYQLFVTEGGTFTGKINASLTEFDTSGDLKLDGETNTETTNVTDGGLTIGSTGTLNTDLTTVSDGATLTLDLGATMNSDIVTINSGGVMFVADSSGLTYTRLNGGGTIDLNGGTFTNKPGATVAGGLTFDGNFTNNGVFAPGNSPGISVVVGNYNENALLEIELGGLAGAGATPDGHDQVRVGGTATIANTSTLVIQGFNNFLPTRGDTFQVIADAAGAAKGFVGTFGTVQFDADGVGGDAPVANAAGVLDVSTGLLTATGLNAAGSTFADLGGNSNQGAAASALFATAQIGQNQIDSSTIAGQLALQIVDATASPAADLALYTPEYYGSMADYAFSGDRAVSRGIQDQVSVFAPLSGIQADQGSFFAGFVQSEVGTEGDTDVSRSDYFVGGDLLAGKVVSIGMALLKNDGSVGSALGSADIDGWGGLLYGRADLHPAFRLWGTLGYTAYDFEIDRPTVNGRVTGSSSADSVTGLLGVGYKGWSFGEVSLAPRLSLVYSHASVDGFTEVGAIDALSNAGYEASLFSAELGFSALWSKELGGHMFSMEVGAALEQDIAASQDALSVQVVSNPATQYQVQFADRDATRAVGRINLGYNLWKTGTVYLGYEGRSGNGAGNFFKTGMRVNF